MESAAPDSAADLPGAAADRHGASDVGVIRYLLERERMEAPLPAVALEVGWLEQYERPLPSLENYDALLTGAGITESVQ